MKKAVWELWYGGNNLTLTVLIIVVALALSVWEEGAFEPYREVGYGQQDDPLPESACSDWSLVTVWSQQLSEMGLDLGRDLGLRPNTPQLVVWCSMRRSPNLIGPHFLVNGSNNTYPAHLRRKMSDSGKQCITVVRTTDFPGSRLTKVQILALLAVVGHFAFLWNTFNEINCFTVL